MFRNPNYSLKPPCEYSTNPVASAIPMISGTRNNGRNNENRVQKHFDALPNTTSNSISPGEVVPHVSLNMREHDEQVFETFLEANKDKFQIVPKKNDYSTSKISEMKTVLLAVYKLNTELQTMSMDLKGNSKILEIEWQEKINSCQKKRADILGLLGKLKEVEVAHKMKRSLMKRSKKRLREKRQRAARILENAAATERRSQLHIKADAWIKDEREVIEREKQEENLRRDADLVLAEVRGKRSDARKFLGLLQELQNLRRVKANIARARGEHMTRAADEAFNNIIAKLVEQWTAIDREYSVEEQGLKLMLQTDENKKFEKRKRNIFADWEAVLFGRKLPSSDLFQRNLNAFVTIRASWDKFISCDGQGSPIPIGWLMPNVPSSVAWKKYLKEE